MVSKWGNILIGIVLCIVSLVFYLSSLGLNVQSRINTLVGPRWAPQLYAIILFCLSLGLIFKYARVNNPSLHENESQVASTLNEWPMVLAVIIIGAVYVWAMPRMGYFESSLVFFIILLRLLKVRSWLTVIGFTAIFLLFVWVVFVKALMISLPVGLLQL